MQKPHLSVAQILQMNLGFLGLQFSFGLQQANMSPIWGYLGAEESNFAWLGIAGPLTGLIVQPIIGSMSDRTSSRWGRRTPYFLIGAVMCCLGLFFMPLSASILMAFSLLFLLDAAGFSVSTGSACQAGVPEASHVLLAMGLSEAEARGALRFSLSESTTEAELDALVTALPGVVERAAAAGLA